MPIKKVQRKKTSRKIKKTNSHADDSVMHFFGFTALVLSITVAIFALLEVVIIGYWLITIPPEVGQTKLTLSLQNAKAKNIESRTALGLQNQYQVKVENLLVRYHAAESLDDLRQVREQLAQLTVPSDYLGFHFRLVSLFDLFLEDLNQDVSGGWSDNFYKKKLDQFIENNWWRIAYK